MYTNYGQDTIANSGDTNTKKDWGECKGSTVRSEGTRYSGSPGPIKLNQPKISFETRPHTEQKCAWYRKGDEKRGYLVKSRVTKLGAHRK